MASILPSEWELDVQTPITLATSEPEPDIAVVAVSADDYVERHPGPADIALVIEVSRSSIFRDRVEKARIYAEAGIPVYWIVYVSKSTIEVFTDPANGKKWRYKTVKQYGKADTVPLFLGGKKIADISVKELID